MPWAHGDILCDDWYPNFDAAAFAAWAPRKDAVRSGPYGSRLPQPPEGVVGAGSVQRVLGASPFQKFERVNDPGLSLERETGIEPATNGLGSRDSST